MGVGERKRGRLVEHVFARAKSVLPRFDHNAPNLRLISQENAELRDLQSPEAQTCTSIIQSSTYP
jgi:hypothetical protein